MNKYTLYESFGSIDDDVLERSEKKRRKKVLSGGLSRWGAVAACACLAVAAALSAREFLAPDIRNDVGELAGQPIDETADGVSGLGGVDTVLSDMPGPEGTAARDAIGPGSGSVPNASDNNLAADVDKSALEAFSGVPVRGGVTPDSTALKTDVPTEEKKPASQFPDSVPKDAPDSGSRDDAAGITMEGCLADDRERLTLQEALDVETLGAYLLAEGPEGFAVESVSYSRREGGGSLYAVWCRQGAYDEVAWSVSLYTEADAGRVTAAADTRNYDLSLYPIPMAESVPEELRQIVDHPIFSIDELTQEVVDRRVRYAKDSGDTSGARMSFGVLYGDVLVEVTAKGVSPEWLYERLSALK